jgi:hypothetical protein
MIQWLAADQTYVDGDLEPKLNIHCLSPAYVVQMIRADSEEAPDLPVAPVCPPLWKILCGLFTLLLTKCSPLFTPLFMCEKEMLITLLLTCGKEFSTV